MFCWSRLRGPPRPLHEAMAPGEVALAGTHGPPAVTDGALPLAEGFLSRARCHDDTGEGALPPVERATASSEVAHRHVDGLMAGRQGLMAYDHGLLAADHDLMARGHDLMASGHGLMARGHGLMLRRQNLMTRRHRLIPNRQDVIPRPQHLMRRRHALIPRRQAVIDRRPSTTARANVPLPLAQHPIARRLRYLAPVSLRIEKSGPVTTVILDRAAVKNAVDRSTAEALAAAFRAFDADDEARVGVLFGDHGTFCAGADLKAIATGEGNRIALEGDGPMGPSRMLLQKPVIAAIAGHAVAGGLELALWCDLRVVEETAVLGVFCRRWGVPLIDGGTIRLPRLIGLSRALDLMLTGRPVDAAEAHAMGLANRVVPTGTARAAAEALARDLAALPQTCMRQDRLSAYEQFGMSLEDALANEMRRGLVSLAAGAVEGAQRFTERKR